MTDSIRTETGKALLDAIFDESGGSMPLDPGAAVAAIEAEARAQALAEVRREVEGLPSERLEASGPIGEGEDAPYDGYVEVVGRAAVLSILERLEAK